MFVADYMTRDPVFAMETDLLSVAEKTAQAKSIHQLPVLDAAKRLVGIITDRDIRSVVGYDRTIREKLEVQEVMTPEPITAAPDDSLSDVLGLFCEHRFGALPVVQATQLVGIITRHDLLMAMSAILGLERDGCSVEAAVPHLFEDLSVAFGALSRFEGTLHSAVVARVRSDGDEPSLYLHVGKHDKVTVENRLRRAGLILLTSDKSHKVTK